MRSRVVLPEPLRPASATHSPGAISSETRRSAYSPPYLLSIFSQQRPMRRANDCVTVLPHGCDLRIVNAPSASNQIAQHLFRDRKSTRLNSSHSQISYAVFCLKKKTT